MQFDSLQLLDLLSGGLNVRLPDLVNQLAHAQASALASPTAGLRSGLPFGSGSPGALSSGMGPLGSGPNEAYASPTRVQSHSGIYGNVAHQVNHELLQAAASNGSRVVADVRSCLAAACSSAKNSSNPFAPPCCACYYG